jgi:dinuclear metal center YbgI/SA1388 family protein
MQITVKDIITEIEKFAPLFLQESYDNCGLLIGEKTEHCTGALLTLDVTEEVVNEAIDKKCNLIIAHHPLIFSGIKKLNYDTDVQRSIKLAIKKDICIYAAHTNTDNVSLGVNNIISQKLELSNTKILSMKNEKLFLLYTYCPENSVDKVCEALWVAGSGNIGNYINCSFRINGDGTFKALENASPFVGKINELHTEKEVKIEMVFEKQFKSEIVSALKNAHPYEEIAYQIVETENINTNIGSGMIGNLNVEISELEFLSLLKNRFNCGTIKHTKLLNKKVKRIAVCGGSGSFLIKDAIRSKADVFVTSDIKYHDFFEADNKILLVDIGHYETEQFTSEIFYDVINKKYTTFALHFSKTNTNPVNYF